MNKNRIKPALAILSFLGFVCCLSALFVLPIPTNSRDILLVVIGALIAMVKDVFGYYFGSSEGSARKTELLNPPIATGTAANSEAGFAALRLLLPLAFLLSFLVMAGCSTLKQDTPQALAAKSLLAMKEAVITVAVTGDRLCKGGTIAPETCQQLAGDYIVAGAAYDLAADALTLALRNNNKQAWLDYQKNQAAFADIYADVMKIGSSTGILQLTETNGGAQ
jgi:hypothetical protein